jgi:hypothetical protein
MRRPRATAPRRRSLAAAVLAAAVAGVLGGCGSSHSGGKAADPAGAVPASATLYVGATVRPSGPLKTAALADGKALTGQANPYLRLLALLQTPGSPTLSFTRDVAPWLGPQAGLFISSIGSSRAQSGLLLSLLEQGLLGSGSGGAFPFGGTAGAQGAIVLDVTDATRARSFLASQARHAGAHAATYRGAAYQLAAGGIALGFVGRFAVLGSESGLRSVIDTTKGGPALARAGGYAKLMAAAPSGAIAHIHVNPTDGAAAGRQSAAGLTQLLVGGHEANLSLVPAQGSIALDADLLPSASPSAPGGLLSAGIDGSQAFGELPGDSWLALGLGHVGRTLGGDVQGLRALLALSGSGSEGSAAGTLNLGSLVQGLFAPLGVLAAESAQARRDFTSWMGSGGIFASGASLLELKGAVVISSQSPALSRAAVSKLGAQLRRAGDSVAPASIPGTDAAIGVHVNGLPVELDIANGRSTGGQTKFVLGLGEASVTAALSPASTLVGASSAKAAAAAIGEGAQPNLVLDVPTLLSLLEGVGLTEDPTISKVLPYLRNVTTVAGGAHSLGGGAQRVRVVLGLR